MTKTSEVKLRENKPRWKASRRGLILRKCAIRDPDAIDYGMFSLQDGRTGVLISPLYGGRSAYSMTLDEVEACLVPEKKTTVKTKGKK